MAELGPLDGILVLDLSHALAGPHATMVLGDLGARVIKVERPCGGDEARSWGPFVGSGDDDRESAYFMCANRDKESVVVDIKSPHGKALLWELVRRADVLVENFSPGTLDRLGFSVEALQQANPQLVILSITAFGHDGPEWQRPGYDQIAQAEGGLMSVTGESDGPPVRIGVPIADVAAGIYGVIGVVSALFDRSRTHRGRVVRTSLLGAAIGMHAYQGTRWTVARTVPERTGSHHASIAPYGSFRASDGFLQLAVASQEIWSRFAPLVGLDPANPAYATNAARMARRDQLAAAIETALAADCATAWVERLRARGIPAGKIRTIDEVYDDPQTRAQGLVVTVDHPSLGPVELPGSPIRFDWGGRVHHSAPPRLGDHDAAIRAWLEESAVGTEAQSRSRPRDTPVAGHPPGSP